MSTLKTLALLALVILTTACGPKKVVTRPQSAPDPILVAEIEQSPEQAEIRRLAEKIKTDEELNRALKAVAEKDTPEMAKARKLLQSDADYRKKNIRRELNVKGRAGLECQSKEDWDRVWISPDAVDRTLGRVHSRMNVFNRGSSEVTITRLSGGGGDVVRNMCPGGRLALVERISMDWYKTLAYSATSSDNGEVKVAYSPSISLSSCWSQYCTTEYVAIWEIR
jgi:hypothetical protein